MTGTQSGLPPCPFCGDGKSVTQEASTRRYWCSHCAKAFRVDSRTSEDN
jgi:transposase-like protein